jgi:hypothetical protein
MDPWLDLIKQGKVHWIKTQIHLSPLNGLSFDPVLPRHLVYQAPGASYHTEAKQRSDNRGRLLIFSSSKP